MKRALVAVWLAVTVAVLLFMVVLAFGGSGR